MTTESRTAIEGPRWRGSQATVCWDPPRRASACRAGGVARSAAGDPICNRPMSRSEMYAILAFLAALAVVSSLRWALPIDEGVFQWMQFHRSCSWIAVSRWIDPVVRAGLALLVGFALVRRGRHDPRSVAPPVLIFVGGLAIVELLKTAIERLRPNSLPGPISGN